MQILDFSLLNMDAVKLCYSANLMISEILWRMDSSRIDNDYSPVSPFTKMIRIASIAIFIILVVASPFLAQVSVSTIVSNLPSAQQSHQLSIHPLSSTFLHTSSLWQPRYCQSACLPSRRTCLWSLRWRQRTLKYMSIIMPRQMNGNWLTVNRPLVSAEPHVPPKLSAPTKPVSKQDWYHTSNTNAEFLYNTISIRCLSSAIRLYGSASVSP